MRIATRLLLALAVAVMTIMGVYAAIALNQRADLISDALIRETDTLAQALQAVTDNALRDGRYMDLDRVLAGVAGDPETYLVAVVGSQGAVMSGGIDDLPDCLHTTLALSDAPGGGRGWAECDGRVRWVSLPVQEPAAAIVVARRATVVEQDEAASRVRISLTTLALGGGAALVILVLLNLAITRPLEILLAGVRRVGGPDPPAPIHLPRSAGELRELAEAFNEMSDRLAAKRSALIREAEERLQLESRVRTEEKFAALGRLTGGLAHEIGTPLNVITVRAERIAESSDAVARQQAGEIMAEADRVTDLIRSLIHLARRDRLNLESLDLREIAQGAARVHARSESVSPAQIRLDTQDTPVRVRGDRNLLRMAMANLIANAVEAAGPDGVSMSVRSEGGEGIAVVRDTGRGIPAELAPHLFEPFFTTKEVGEGMGLGLAISRGIIEEHGGTLKIHENEPHGVVAMIHLPLERS